MKIIDFIWFPILFIPAILITVSKYKIHSNQQELESGPLGKILVGIFYISLFFILIEFQYIFEILVLSAILLYVNLAIDVKKLIFKKKWFNNLDFSNT